MIANENEFDESLKKLGDLYEEAKDCLTYMSSGFDYGSPEEIRASRLHAILREMRDLSAVNMKKLHLKIDN